MESRWIANLLLFQQQRNLSILPDERRWFRLGGHHHRRIPEQRFRRCGRCKLGPGHGYTFPDSNSPPIAESDRNTQPKSIARPKPVADSGSLAIPFAEPVSLAESHGGSQPVADAGAGILRGACRFVGGQ